MINKMNLSEFEAAFKSRPGKIIDVRTRGEFNAGHLDGAVNIDWLGGEVHNRMNDFSKEETYYLYCASGNRSGQATAMLKQHGFENVYNIGGYAEVMYADI